MLSNFEPENCVGLWNSSDIRSSLCLPASRDSSGSAGRCATFCPIPGRCQGVARSGEFEYRDLQKHPITRRNQVNILLIVIVVIAVILAITGGLVNSLQFLLWVGLVLLAIQIRATFVPRASSSVGRASDF